LLFICIIIYTVHILTYLVTPLSTSSYRDRHGCHYCSIAVTQYLLSTHADRQDVDISVTVSFLSDSYTITHFAMTQLAYFEHFETTLFFSLAKWWHKFWHPLWYTNIEGFRGDFDNECEFADHRLL